MIIFRIYILDINLRLLLSDTYSQYQGVCLPLISFMFSFCAALLICKKAEADVHGPRCRAAVDWLLFSSLPPAGYLPVLFFVMLCLCAWQQHFALLTQAAQMSLDMLCIGVGICKRNKREHPSSNLDGLQLMDSRVSSGSSLRIAII